MNKKQLLELSKSVDLALALRSGAIPVELERVELMSEASPFAGQFTADRSKAYIEFDVCNCLPVVAGPTYGTGNYIGYHPGVLAKNHGTLLHQQTNLHHHIKAYDPKNIKQDQIVGCVVGTSYAKAPEGGWQIPESAADAIPIRACAVLFKQAEGAAQMLKDIKEGKVTGAAKRKWSVSIEVITNSYEDLGLWIPSQKKIVPLLEADDDLLAAIEFQKETKRLLVGKYKGEQLVLVYGSINGKLHFQGVGYTPTPAEKRARITSALASAVKDLSVDVVEEGFMALSAASVDFLEQEFSLEDLSEKLSAYSPGATVVRWSRSEKVFIPGNSFHVQGAEEDPAVLVKLRTGQFLLKKNSELQKLFSKNSKNV